MTINKLITNVNRWSGRFGYDVEWIVLHYTAGVGDTARGNCQYFQNDYRAASAHFFVDETSIWQSVELADTAWHCGDAASRNGCVNMNSIGIEMCSDKDAAGNYYISDATVDMAANLVWYLLGLYPNAKLCRHYDVTGKSCPAPWVTNNQLWIDFQNKIEEGLPMTPAERKEFDTLKQRVIKLEGKETKDYKTVDSKINTVETNMKTNFETVDKSIKAINAEVMPRWDEIDSSMPKWMKPTIQKLVDEGLLKGVSDDDLRLSYLLARVFVVLDRMGVFDE